MIDQLKRKYAKCETLLMRTMHVKLSYEKVIQDAIADKTIKDKLLTLIKEGSHQKDAA